MRIVIEYHSIWQNSVLNGSNDEPFNRKSNPRNFKASSKSTEKPDVKEITLNTVLGILCRLIGDQRKLYQAQREFYQFGDYNFHFKDMDISFRERQSPEQWEEIVSLINKSENRPQQKKFLGVLDENEPLFFSEYSATFWSILDLSFDELLDFIIQPNFRKIEKEVSPSTLLNKIQFDIGEMENIELTENKIQVIKEKIYKENAKEKPNEKAIQKFNNEISELKNISPELIDFENKLKKCLSILENYFDISYLEKNGSIKPISLYSASLYLMLRTLKENNIDVTPFQSDRGGVKGFSTQGFNGVRDFLNSLTGGKKQTTHTPYTLTKASGQLEIILNIEPQRAIELKQMIDNAGVSSFYLGKKGLAYVIEIKEK